MLQERKQNKSALITGKARETADSNDVNHNVNVFVSKK